jgi:hypothetical protein
VHLAVYLFMIIFMVVLGMAPRPLHMLATEPHPTLVHLQSTYGELDGRTLAGAPSTDSNPEGCPKKAGQHTTVHMKLHIIHENILTD